MIFEAALSANIVATSKYCHPGVSVLNYGEFAPFFGTKYIFADISAGTNIIISCKYNLLKMF